MNEQAPSKKLVDEMVDIAEALKTTNAPRGNQLAGLSHRVRSEIERLQRENVTHCATIASFSEYHELQRLTDLKERADKLRAGLEPSPDFAKALERYASCLRSWEQHHGCWETERLEKATAELHVAARATQPPSVLRLGLERAIEIVSSANVPNDYYKPFVDRLVELLDEAIGASETKEGGHT